MHFRVSPDKTKETLIYVAFFYIRKNIKQERKGTNSIPWADTPRAGVQGAAAPQEK